MDAELKQFKKILLNTDWQNYQILPNNTVLPIEGYTNPNHKVNCYLFRELKNNQYSTWQSVWQISTFADSKGHFAVNLPEQAGDINYYYHLICEVIEEQNNFTFKNNRERLNEHNDNCLFVKYLSFGEVWLLVGSAVNNLNFPLTLNLDHRDAEKLESCIWGNVENPETAEISWHSLAEKPVTKFSGLIYSFLKSYIDFGLSSPVAVITYYSEDLQGDDLADIVTGTLADSILANIPINRLFIQPGLCYLNNLAKLSDDIYLFLKTVKKSCFFSDLQPDKSLPTVILGQMMTPAVLAAENRAGLSLAYYNSFLANLKIDKELLYFLPSFDLPLDYRNEFGKGEPDYPLHKSELGRRWAFFAKCISQKEAVKIPVVKDIQLRGDHLLVKVDLARDDYLLEPEDEPIREFYLADMGGKFRPALAKLCGNTEVKLFHPDLPTPKHCAYAMSSWNILANLRTKSGFPVLPFTTKIGSNLQPLPYLSLANLDIWSMQSNNIHSVKGLPGTYPIFKANNGNRLDVRKLTSFDFIPEIYRNIVKNYISIDYQILSQAQINDRKKWCKSAEFWPLFFLSSFTVPPTPDFTDYLAVTCLIRNTDERIKEIKLWNMANQIVEDNNKWQFFVWHISPSVLDEDLPLFSVFDPGENNLQRGSLQFAALDFWYNEVLAERFLKNFNNKGFI